MTDLHFASPSDKTAAADYCIPIIIKLHSNSRHVSYACRHLERTFFLYRFTLIMFTGRGIEGPCLSLSYNNGITLNPKLLVDFFFFLMTEC